MNKLLILVGLLCCLLNTLHAQSGSRYPIDTTSVWRVNHIRNGVSDEKTHVEGDEIYKYFIHGDTTIGPHTYYKIYKTGTSYLDVVFYYENVYAGAFRNDNNKLYLVKKNTTEEVLLYNFDAKVDDTIQVPYNGSFETKIVSAVDSLPDGRKIIHFNPKEPVIGCGDQYMIEGIGGSGGLLEGPACFHYWTFDNHLVCFVQQDMLVYHDYNFNFNCEIIDDNNDKPYLDSTCVWRIDKQETNINPVNFEKFRYFISNDTIISTNKYWKLCKSGYQLYIPENGEYSSHFNNSVYVGALREFDHKIYFIENGESEEDVLYNFNLHVSEAIDAKLFQGDTINTIDTILDNRKFFYLSDHHWENFLMEGIGSDKGLLENTDANSTLVCFMQNGATVYHNATGAECNLNYNEINFPDCDQIYITPKPPSVNDALKMVARMCYQVSYSNPQYPVLSNYLLIHAGTSFTLTLYYDYNDLNTVDDIKTVFPVFDTISLGKLAEGRYSINLMAHTIHHNNEFTDTTFFDKNGYFSFNVTQGNDIEETRINQELVRIYPIPARHFITIELTGKDEKITSVTLYDMLGRKAEYYEPPYLQGANMFEMNIANYPEGIYIIKINTENNCFTKRVLIK